MRLGVLDVGSNTVHLQIVDTAPGARPNPTEVTVSSEEIRKAIEEQISRIIDAIKSTLDVTPPDLVADLVTTGMTIAGGGAMIKGLVQRISRECGMPVRMAEDPLTSVVTGAGICAENMGLLKQVVLPEKR